MSSRPCRSDIDSHVATRIMMRGPRAVRRARQPWPTMTAERRHITHERRDDIARRIRDLTLALEVLNHTIHDYVGRRSEEHTSELQSRGHLVCRLLIEKKKVYLIL